MHSMEDDSQQTVIYFKVVQHLYHLHCTSLPAGLPKKCPYEGTVYSAQARACARTRTRIPCTRTRTHCTRTHCRERSRIAYLTLTRAHDLARSKSGTRYSAHVA